MQTTIENPLPFPNATHVDLGTGFDDCKLPPHLRRAFASPHQTRSSSNLRHLNVIVDPTSAQVFATDGVVAMTSRRGDEQLAAERRIAGPCVPLAGRVFMGFNRWSHNHFHWLTQCVPAIAAYAADPDFSTGTILLPRMSASHRRALALAGVSLPETQICAGPAPLRIDDLTYSTLLTTAWEPSLFNRAVFARMVARAENVSTGAPTRRIYIWRIDTQARPMRNEDALVELLLRYGIEPVIASTLSLDAQIALFHDARLVVGGHGAGLANIVFCQPGATVYELLPSHWPMPEMAALAHSASLNYWADMHASEVVPGSHGRIRADLQYQTSWSVDLDAVERRLAALLARDQTVLA